MADYWKSQARKYCDFCKCWIADNKPSIQFHETGKRHKENVAQKLAQLTKQSVKEKKESIKVDEEMRKMEEAAMKAYMKDIESNPDYTSKLIIDKVMEKKSQLELEQQQLTVQESTTSNKDEEEQSTNVTSDNATEEQPVWYEAQSDEGYTYFWNHLTGESVWEPPKEGYVSIAEQQSTEKKEQSLNENKSDESEIKREKVVAKGDSEESVSKDNRKRKKDADAKTVDTNKTEEIESSSAVVIGPSVKPDPYGGWTVVDKSVPEPVDLQLPQQDYIEIKVPVLESDQPQIKFKEKTITSLGNTGGGPSTFKKRKFSANRGNMRRKTENEDDDDDDNS